jgi:2-polyprenyl-6-methoxyphenol hydroxylase-like FAD-dependent oxidoreductase
VLPSQANQNKAEERQGKSDKMPLKVLVIGAGVCGPAFATMLHRSDPGHQITIVERAEKLRESGLQIDLRSQGIPIVQKMGCKYFSFSSPGCWHLMEILSL